jgi:hypothetical protein
MGSTNFLPFNPSQANQESDSAYLVDATRTGGAGVDALWPSPSANKTLYQVAGGVYALMQMMATKGFTTLDSNLATLTAVMANLLTTADVPIGLQSVPWTSTPVFNAAKYGGFQVTLSGASTAFTISGQTPGQIVGLIWVQDGTGSRVVTFPGNVNGGAQPDSAAGVLSCQLFKADAAGNLDAVGPAVSVNGLTGSAVNALTLTVAGAAPSGKVLTGNGTSYVPAPGISGVTPSFVTGSRAFGTQYQNTDATPRTVSVYGSLNLGVGHNASAVAYIGSGSASNPVAANSVTNGPGYAGVTFIVPPGWYYEVQTDVGTDTNPLTLVAWTEWGY